MVASVAASVVGLSVLPTGAVESDTTVTAEHDTTIRDAVDAIMAEHLSEDAGAVVAVDGPGGPSFLEGYGVADPAAGTPVDPETTRFPVASVSKAITATAATASAHAGELDLATPAQDATGIDLPGDDGSVTLHHLLTHTAGLDEPLLLFPPAPEPAPDLHDRLAEHPPHASHRPGLGVHYSPAAGYALVGVALERATSATFDEVVAREVFEPIGMERATFEDLPAPEPDDAHLPGYPGGVLPVTIERPAVSLRVTGPDMAAWIEAALGGGGLAPEVVGAITEVDVRPPQGVGGHTGVLFEQVRGGVRTLEQASGLGWVALFPDAEVGVFVAITSGDLAGLLAMLQVVETVAAAVEPGGDADPHDWPEVVPAWTEVSWQHVAPTGSFHELSLSGRGPEGLLRGFTQPRLTADGEALRWDDRVLEPTGDRWCDERGCVTGRRADDGRVYLLRSDAEIAEQQQTLVRAPWYRLGELTVGVAVVTVATGVAAIVAWIRREVDHRRRGMPTPIASRAAALWAMTTLGAVGTLAALLVTALSAHLSWVETDAPLAMTSMVLAWLSVTTGVVATTVTLVTWPRRRPARRARAAVAVVVPLVTAAWTLTWAVG